ncbi:MAG: hypothetical protein WBG46_14465 [Nonlabens sp.]
METTLKEIQLPLEEKDKKTIRFGLIGVFAVPVVFGLFIYFGFGMLSPKPLFAGEWDFMDYGLAVFMTLVTGVCAFLAVQKSSDLRVGMKTVHNGVIMDKRKAISQSTSNSGGTRRGGSSRTKTTVNYHITLNDKEYNVGYSKFSKVKVGDVVKLSQAPKSKLILDFEVLENTKEPEIDEYGTTKQVNVHRVKKASLSQRDLGLLRSRFRESVKSKIIFAAIPLIIIIGLITSNMVGLLIFLFPIPLIALWQLFKILRLYLKYRTAKSGNTKEIITTTVLDQLTTTRNGSITKRVLITEAGKVEVSPEFYQSIPDSKIIEIHKIPEMDLVLETRISD